MIRDSLNITINGEAGDGVLSAGEILCDVFFEAGVWLCTYKNFPSRIRGGHTSYSIRIADDFCLSRAEKTDILLAFDEDAFLAHNNELKSGSIVIYDPAKIKNIIKSDNMGITYYEIPLADLSTKNFAKALYKNSIMIGVVAAILEIDSKHIQSSFIKYIKAKKGEEAFKINMQAYDLGVQYYKNVINGKNMKMPACGFNKDMMMISGNDSCVIGALAGGCRFIAAYPISPATEIFEAMCSLMPEFGGTALQAEDEIAAVCAAIGAGFGGTRAMSSTSGPGISLMAEAIGLSGCSEVPLVIIDAQRPGPSTGLPTKTEQGDINHVIFCSHGDIPRIVISAGNVRESFEFTANAFNLAEICQCPVILLSEQSIAQNKFAVKKFDLSKIEIDRGKLLSEEELLAPGYKFARYEFTNDGISPRAIPSQKGGVHLCNGNEHEESGRITEDPELRTKMTDKRMKKIDAARVSKYLPAPKYFGDDNAKYGIIVTGYNSGAAAEAIDKIKTSKGCSYKVMQLTALLPFPDKEALEFIKKYDKIFVIENNKSAQLSGLIKMHIPLHDKLVSILKYDGIAFSADEIVRKLMEAV